MHLIPAWMSCASLLFYNNILHTTASTTLPSANQILPVTIDQTNSKDGRVISPISQSSPDNTTVSTTVPSNVAPVFKKGSVGAVYIPGHSIAVPERCPNLGKFIDLMILIMSARGNFNSRMAIRQTWGHFGQRKDVGIGFVIGSGIDDKLEKTLEEEEDTYGDIIRSKSIDSYTNLTLKVLSMLEWVDTYCSNARFVLKSDDDMFINVPKLLSFIKDHKSDTNVIYGHLRKNAIPHRDEKHKWFVPMDEFNSTNYPDYVTGQAYLISGELVHSLYEASLNETFVRMEDVFLTGIVAENLGVQRVDSKEFNMSYPADPCVLQRNIHVHEVTYKNQFKLWADLLDGQAKC